VITGQLTDLLRRHAGDPERAVGLDAHDRIRIDQQVVEQRRVGRDQP
jgi:hypothetical protein